MNLKDYIKEGTNISVQFYDEYDENKDKIVKMVEYSQGRNKSKKFPLKDLSDKIPGGVILSIKKAIQKETGIDLENIDKLKKFAGKNFKYKDGAYDISFTITGDGDKRRGTSNIDAKELKKSISGKKSPAEEKQELIKKEKERPDIQKMSKEVKGEIEKRKKKKHNVLSREIERASFRDKHATKKNIG